MPATAIRQVSVWLDESAPRQGAFSHALDWATRLRLPLRGVVPSEEKLRGLAAESRTWHATTLRTPPPAGKTVTSLLAACEATCVQRGVRWEYTLWQGSVSQGVEQFLQPAALGVFGNALANAVKGALLRQSLRGVELPILICPQAWKPLARVLVLNQPSDCADYFLDTVARLCGLLGVLPIVLTVARNERVALDRQRTAKETWEARGLAADFDILIGCEVRTAVASVARWRRCTHVFVERQHASPWWRWLRGDTLGRLLGLSDSFSFLAIPAGKPAPGEWEAPLVFSEATEEKLSQ